MKIKTYITLLMLGTLWSCNDDFLDRAPQDQLTDANFWQTEQHLQSVANTFTESLQGKYWLNMTEIMADSAPWAVNTAFRTIGAGNFTTETSQINSIWDDCYTNIGRTNSPVTPVYLSGSVAEGTQVAMDLRENYNLFCSIVVYPVIPKGQLLLRLIPTAMHTLEDVDYTVKAFKAVAEKLAKGEYSKDVVVDANAL